MSNLNKKFNNNWKTVKIKGNIEGDKLEGFAGLEILENYDPKLFTGNVKKRNLNFLSNDLQNEVFDIRNCEDTSDSESNNDDNDDEEKLKPPEKRFKDNNYAGKYVLLRPKNFFTDETNAAILKVFHFILSYSLYKKN
jgi:hypothetical protein